jgi:DnaK suppressor protein
MMNAQKAKPILEQEQHRLQAEIAALDQGDPANDELRDVNGSDDDDSSENEDHSRIQARGDASKAFLKTINRALQKIEEGTYGMDDLTHQPIPVERLEAMPWAIYTVESEEKIESRQR